jgi:thiol-disulfide isomerase/thioredoxin
MDNDYPAGLEIPRLLDPNKNEVSGQKILGDDRIKLIYAGAFWCPPCQIFSKELDEFAGRNAQDVCVVYVSQDHDQQGFDQYTSKWKNIYSIPFADVSIRQNLSIKFAIWALPTLVVVGPDGTHITSWGRAAVSRGDSCIQDWKAGYSGVTRCVIS